MTTIKMSRWNIPNVGDSSTPVRCYFNAFDACWRWAYNAFGDDPPRANDHVRMRQLVVDCTRAALAGTQFEGQTFLPREALRLLAVWCSYTRREGYRPPPQSLPDQLHFHRDIYTKPGMVKIPNGPWIEVPGFNLNDLRTVGLSLIVADGHCTAKIFSVHPSPELGETIESLKEGYFGAKGMNSVSLQMLGLPSVKEHRAAGSPQFSAPPIDLAVPKPVRRQQQLTVLQKIQGRSYKVQSNSAYIDALVAARDFTWDFIYMGVFGVKEFEKPATPLARWQMIRSAVLSGRALKMPQLLPLRGVQFDFLHGVYLAFVAHHALMRKGLRGPMQLAERELPRDRVELSSGIVAAERGLVLSKPVYYYEQTENDQAAWPEQIALLEGLGWSRTGSQRSHKTRWHLHIAVDDLPSVADLLVQVTFMYTDNGWRVTIGARERHITHTTREETCLRAWLGSQRYMTSAIVESRVAALRAAVDEHEPSDG